MKKIIFSFALLTLSFAAVAQSDTKYDKALAEKLGGDDYGMKSYIFVILKTGSADITDKKKVDSLFAGHMRNIEKMAADGKLYVAGPMSKNDKNYRGIFILNVKTMEEAKALLANDPAVTSKMLEAEMYSWYGSAALGEYLPAHDKIVKKKF